jgi:hypothetical protein
MDDKIFKVPDAGENVVIRILPPKKVMPFYATRVHRLHQKNKACPICEYEKQLSEKQKANGAGGRKKKRWRNIDEPWEASS